MIKDLNQPIEDAAFWQKHINQFQAEHQTKTKYCKTHGLNYHRFLYWHAKLAKSNEDGSATLIPIRVSEPNPKKTSRCIASLELSHGTVIKLFDEEIVLKLIKGFI